MKWICRQNQTLLNDLAEKMPEASKTTLRSMIKEGRVKVDGAVTKQNISLTQGAACELSGKKIYDTDLEIYYDDDDIVVVNKPEGLLSVSTAKELHNTLHMKLKKKYSRVWPVHRLDKETSGVLVFALNHAAKEGLKKQFIDHSIEREYRAIVVGNIPDKGIWRHHLVEDGNFRMHITDSTGLYAETHFEVLDREDDLALVRFMLKTGKKNQIRVQASHMGFPILGDKKYAERELRSTRMFLHAHKLHFNHPITKKKMSFNSPIPFSIR